MDIELLQGTLEVNATPGLETIDPRFSDIAALVMDGQYEEAAAQSVEVLEQRIYDIRIIGYALYGHFLDHGIGAMAEISSCLASLLTNNLEALGPARKREKHIQTILNWLLKQLLKKMQYEEEKQSSLYEMWLSGVSSDEIRQALDAMDELGRALRTVLEDEAGPVLDGAGKVSDWLKAFQKLVYREPGPETELEPESESEPLPEKEREMFGEEEMIEPERKVVDRPDNLLAQQGLDVEVSYHLNLLMKKLEAFDRLISEEKYAGAALVADDINKIIADFDPKLYFPKLFSGFSLLYASHVNDLSTFNEYKGTPEWHALEDLYQVDLERFISFEPDLMDFSVPSPEFGSGEGLEEGDSDRNKDMSYLEGEPDEYDQYGEDEV